MKIHDGDHLKLGTLDGNQFEILLRDCSLFSDNESKKPKVDLTRSDSAPFQYNLFQSDDHIAFLIKIIGKLF